MNLEAAREATARPLFQQLEARLLLDAGPMITGHWPDGLTPTSTDYVEVTFNEPIDPATFDAGDVMVMPPFLVSLGSHDTPGYAYDVEVVGSLAYVADGGSGLHIFDVADPAAPALVGSYDTPGYAYDVEVAGSLAYVADSGSGLQIIDVTDPAAPAFVGSYDTPGSALDVEVVGSLAYVADSGGGLQIINVTDPAAPAPAGSYDTPGFARDVEIVGSLAYVADRSSGLQIIDVSDPAEPAPAGSYDTPGSAYNVEVVGSLAYVADNTSGLRIIDVTDPAAPAPVGSYNTPGDARDVAIVGSLAYVADADGGLGIIDVSDPAAPAPVASYATPGDARDVAIVGSLAYVADDYMGLHILRAQTPVLAVTQQDSVTYHVEFAENLADGDYLVRVRPGISDPEGNLMDQDGDGTGGESTQDVYYFTFTVDTTPPGPPTDLGISPDTGRSSSDGLTDTTDLVFAWTPADDLSSIVGYEYRVDEGEWRSVGVAQANIVADEGEHILEVRSIDEALRTGQSAQLTVVVDTTTPSAPEDITIDHATLKWSDSTDANGIWKYHYRINGGDWRDAPATPMAGLKLLAGTYTFDVRAADDAGNVGESATAVLELTSPITGRWVEEAAFPLSYWMGKGYSASIEGDLVVIGTLDKVLVFERGTYGGWLHTAYFEIYPGGVSSSQLHVQTAIDNGRIVAGTLDTVLVLERDGDGIWQSRQLELVGSSQGVDISGDRVIVGGKWDWGGPAGIIYTRQPDGAWVATDTLTPPGGLPYYGPSAAISGDVAVVGDFEGEGVHVFEKGAGGVWSWVAYLETGFRTDYGEMVGADGQFLAAGSLYPAFGKGEIYERQGDGAWRLYSKLEGTGQVALDGDTVATASSGQFGAGTWITVRDPGGAWIDRAQFPAPGSDVYCGVGTDGDRVIVAGEYDVRFYVFDSTPAFLWSDFRDGTKLEFDLGLTVDDSGGTVEVNDNELVLAGDSSGEAVGIARTLPCEDLLTVSFDYRWTNAYADAHVQVVLGGAVLDMIPYVDSGPGSYPEPAVYNRTFNLADFGLSAGDLGWQLRLVKPPDGSAEVLLDNMLINMQPIELPGDSDLDGDVDLDDLFAVRNHFGTAGSWSEGNFDGDGTVGLEDLLMIRNNLGYGMSAAPDESMDLLSTPSPVEDGGELVVASLPGLPRRSLAKTGASPLAVQGRAKTRSAAKELAKGAPVLVAGVLWAGYGYPGASNDFDPLGAIDESSPASLLLTDARSQIALGLVAAPKENTPAPSTNEASPAAPRNPQAARLAAAAPQLGGELPDMLALPALQVPLAATP